MQETGREFLKSDRLKFTIHTCTFEKVIGNVNHAL